MAKTLGRLKLKRPASRWIALAVAGAVTCGALAACSGNSSNSERRGSDAQIAARTVAPGKPVSDKKIDLLRVGIVGQVTTLNPLEDIAAGIYTNSLGLESLLRVDKDGEVQPWLAASFEQKSDTVWEYKLRPGVKFSDGTDLTADDVKFSYDLRIDQAKPFFTSIAKVDAPDKATVVVTLKQPDASWKFTPALFFTTIVQKKFFEENPDDAGKPGTLLPSTGPWKFDSLNPTTGLQLSANPYYWGGKPPIAKISVKSFQDENAMGLALRAGEIDFVPAVNAPKGFDSAAGGDVTTTVPTCATALVSMPTKTGPWDDVNVRRAVAYAIDRKDVVAATQGRAGGPLDSLISPMLLEPLGTKAEVQDALASLPQYPFDLAKAKTEMAKSKSPEGFKDTFLTTSTTAPVVQVLAAQLKKINIDLEVKLVGDTEFTSTLIGPADKRPLNFTETGACTPDPSWNDLYLGTLPDGSAPKTINYANYTPKDIDDLQAEALRTTDPKKRLDVYTSILKRVQTDVPYVPVYAEGATYGSKTYDMADFGSYWASSPWALNLVEK